MNPFRVTYCCWIAFFFAICIALAAPSPALAASDAPTAPTAPAIWSPGSVEVIADSKESLSAGPGEIVSTVFRVKNSNDSVRTYSPILDLPAGWQSVSSLESFEVAANSEARRLVSFRIPTGSPVGRFEIRYRVTDSTDPKTNDAGSIVVNIGAVRNVDLELIDSPGYALAGEPYKASFLVANSGNSVFSGTLKIRSVPEFPFEVSETSFVLAPNAQLPLEITVNSKVLGDRRFRHWLQVQVVAEGGEVLATSSASVDMLPAFSSNRKPGVLPASVKLIGFNSFRGTGAQAEFGVRGSIREDSDTVIDFFARTPDQSTSSLFGRRDEYRLALISDQVAIRLGDHRYSLSPLTEYGRVGRGIGVDRTQGPLTVGAFYNRNRYTLPREDLVGLSLTYALTERIKFGANVLNKTGAVKGQTITIRTQAEPVRGSFLDLEFGDGGRGATRSTGVSAHAYGRYDIVSYDARHLTAGPQFPGLYHDYDNTSISFQVRPGEGFSFDAAFQQQQRTFSTVLGFAESITKHIRTGPTYHKKWGRQSLSSSIHYVFQAQNLSSNSVWNTRNRRSAKMKVDYSIGRLAFGLVGEKGEVASNQLDSGFRNSRYEFSTRANLGRVTASSSIQRSSGATLNRLTNHQTNMFSSTVDMRIADATQIGVNFFTLLDNSSFSRQYSLFSTRLNHRFPFGHVVGMQTNLSSFGSLTRDLFGDVAVTYEIPFGIRGLKSSGPKVSGRVVDADSGEGIPGAVLRLGRTRSVTDENGSFEFDWDVNALQYLFIEQTSIGLERIAMVPMPLAVTQEVQAASIEIPVSQAGQISGIVQRFDYSDGSRQKSELEVVGPEPSVVVEATDGVGSVRATTDSDGTFRFRNLRPGVWTVRIVYANLPDTYLAENPKGTHRVLPGGSADVALRVVPKVRKIKFVARGRIDARDKTSGQTSQETNLKQDSPQGDSLLVQGRETATDGVVAATIREALEEERAATPHQERHNNMDVMAVDWTGECSPAPAGGKHNVKAGQSLAGIARYYYCDAVMWPKIWFANPLLITDPHIIDEGIALEIPRAKRVIIESLPEPLEVSTYTVKRDETLYSIASETMGRANLWPRIWLANRDLVGEDIILKPGMVLTIPGSELLPAETRVLFGR